MQPNAQERDVQSSGVAVSGTFGISHEDTAHLMGILRDSMYTDRIMAVLREYASNAWDANREAGKDDTPIKIHVPTHGSPTLTIRDNGRGLSESDVFNVYTQYGRSTKRGSDVAVGMLGIGSKSAFSYSDQFTVTSWQGGMKRVYVASLDETDLGIMQRLHEEPCDKDETGVEVKVAVRPEDIWEFQRKANSLYSNFRPRPSINIALRPEQEASAELDNGIVYEDDGDWVALMGCVPYRINIEQLRGDEEAEALWASLQRMSGVLYFDIGQVEMAASREELRYSKKTKAALLAKFGVLVEEYVRHTLAVLKGNDLSPWDKRLRLQGLTSLGLPLPDSAKAWAATSVRLYEDGTRPATFIVLRGGTEALHVGVSANTRLLIKNDSRKLKGYSLGDKDYVVKPTGGADLKAVRKELDKVLKKAKLGGVPVADISTLPWQEWKAQAGTRKHNAKHKVTSFRLVSASNGYKRSDNWEIVNRTPDEDDVFVIINRFEAVDFANFYRAYGQDRAMADVLGLDMPDVYGYKTTERKPVTEADCEGITYREWRKHYFDNRMTPTLWRYISFYRWADALSTSWTESYYSAFVPVADRRKPADVNVLAKKVTAHLTELLGADHPIVALFAKHVRGYKAIANASPTLRNGGIEALIQRFGNAKTCKAEEMKDEISARYPLFDRYANIEQLWTQDDRYSIGNKASWKSATEWVEYIKMIDERLAAEEEATADEEKAA